MGILNKKKVLPPEIPHSVRRQVQDELLQHFSQYEFSRKGSETVLSKVLPDKVIEQLYSLNPDFIEDIKTSVAHDEGKGMAELIAQYCIERAELLDKDNALEPLLDEYFAKHGNFR